MGKRILLTLIVILALYTCVYFSYMAGVDAGYSKGTHDSFLKYANQMATVDRTEHIRYPQDKYRWSSKVYIWLAYDSYYHSGIGCSFIMTTEPKDMLCVSEYEAAIRNYRPCPNCVIEEVDIRDK